MSRLKAWACLSHGCSNSARKLSILSACHPNSFVWIISTKSNLLHTQIQFRLCSLIYFTLTVWQTTFYTVIMWHINLVTWRFNYAHDIRFKQLQYVKIRHDWLYMHYTHVQYVGYVMTVFKHKFHTHTACWIRHCCVEYTIKTKELQENTCLDISAN